MLLRSYLMMGRQKRVLFTAVQERPIQTVSVLRKSYQAVQVYDSLTLTNEN